MIFAALRTSSQAPRSSLLVSPWLPFGRASRNAISSLQCWLFALSGPTAE